MNKILTINARVMMIALQNTNPKATIKDISTEQILSFKQKGYDALWLLGVWDNRPVSIGDTKVSLQYINEYRRVLPDITEKDVIDSCFAINDYLLNPLLGNDTNLLDLKKRLNEHGIKLILDFIPNHFHYASELLSSAPEIFVHGNRESMQKSGDSHYQWNNSELYFAHGKDPYTGSWLDTVQLNWLHPMTHEFMLQRLKAVSMLCDGVRCDMAMLVLPEIFEKTWSGWLNASNINDDLLDKANWWERAIKEIKLQKPEFAFIAECYWDTHIRLLDSGFDYVYNKGLYDLILKKNPSELRYYLQSNSYLPQSVVFLENHDEGRITAHENGAQLHTDIVLQATLPGLKLYLEGQEEGNKTRLPVQLGRRPIETMNMELYRFYQHVFDITCDPVFLLGDFEVIDPLPVELNSSTHNNLIAYKRSYRDKHYIIVINMSNTRSRGYIQFIPEINDSLGTLIFEDKLNNTEYSYSRALLMSHHLFIELKPWSSHILEVKEVV